MMGDTMATIHIDIELEKMLDELPNTGKTPGAKLKNYLRELNARIEARDFHIKRLEEQIGHTSVSSTIPAIRPSWVDEMKKEIVRDIKNIIESAMAR